VRFRVRITAATEGRVMGWADTRRGMRTGPFRYDPTVVMASDNPPSARGPLEAIRSAGPERLGDDDAPVRREARLVTVVIPVRNGAATIVQQLEALRRQTYRGEWEIVVADNGSTDETVARCEAFSLLLPIRVVDASGRAGSSYARNVGAAQARGDLLLFCDADDVVDDGWMEALVRAAADYDFVGGVQEEFLLNDDDALSTRALRSKQFVRPLGFLPFVPTCNLAMWADVFADLQGLCENYPQAHDVEFSWRAQLASYRLGFAADAIVHYRYRTTMKGLARQGYLSGLDIARLVHDFRGHGLRVPSRGALLVRWGRMIAGAPVALVSPRRRGPWLRGASTLVGRLVGDVRLRFTER
jgi:hypothetical protein